MFTGIVQGQGRIRSVTDQRGIRTLVIDMPSADFLVGLETGASIAVNGTCLTVVDFADSWAQFDVIEESLRLTNLSELQVDSAVNIERAARFGDEIGGHLLSGHIHCQAQITERIENDGNLDVFLQVPASHANYVLSKGYIAIDGISLTIGEQVVDGRFSVHLIPETRRMTNLNSRTVGDHVNIEIDSQTQAVVDTVERVLRERHSA
ncbi:riboflavin synthase subunit alpha [Echinimonas agarilytica]|uniref:Riboflavin synthase n=1 Tax=Echinimonas agarilytica TaxID=1215918 RepID=A0AA42B7D9_9GAMM|nr:riboflavin synthase subunit alpha [Echinimonas agarilytica]MCM2679481.1 riboflavin synthase subunit alpha [Echinimonas agarilytica]